MNAYTMRSTAACITIDTPMRSLCSSCIQMIFRLLAVEKQLEAGNSTDDTIEMFSFLDGKRSEDVDTRYKQGAWRGRGWAEMKVSCGIAAHAVVILYQQWR